MIKKGKFTEKTPYIFIALFLFILLALVFYFQRFTLFPKIIIILLIIFSAAGIGKLRPLIKDWFVFVAFVYLFDSLRGMIYILICKLNLPVYTLYVITIENFFFKTIPSVFLQTSLLESTSPGNFTWLEKFLTFIHGSHFIAFLLVGFFIWLKKPTIFNLYKISFYLAMALGLLGYFLVPTVPPWLAASQFNLFPSLTHFNVVLFNILIPDISNGFDTNPIAAMPSLHALFPLLCSFLLFSIYRWKAAPFYLYTLLVLFAIVYSGDHYITDILAGLILALICYFTAIKILKVKNGRPKDFSPVESVDGLSRLKNGVILGLIILMIGISIGMMNKKAFLGDPDDYSLNAPRYVDFSEKEEKYTANFHVQMYFGEYHVVREDYQSAYPHFQRCLALSTDTIQEKKARQHLVFSRRMIQAQSKW